MQEEQRKAVYALVTALLSCAAAFGLVGADDAAAISEACVAVIGALTTLLAYVNTGTGKHKA